MKKYRRLVSILSLVLVFLLWWELRWFFAQEGKN